MSRSAFWWSCPWVKIIYFHISLLSVCFSQVFWTHQRAKAWKVCSCMYQPAVTYFCIQSCFSFSRKDLCGFFIWRWRRIVVKQKHRSFEMSQKWHFFICDGNPLCGVSCLVFDSGSAILPCQTQKRPYIARVDKEAFSCTARNQNFVKFTSAISKIWRSEDKATVFLQLQMNDLVQMQTTDHLQSAHKIYMKNLQMENDCFSH